MTMDIDVEFERLRGMLAAELQREFPGSIIRPLPDGGWVAVWGKWSDTEWTAITLRAKLAEVAHSRGHGYGQG